MLPEPYVLVCVQPEIQMAQSRADVRANMQKSMEVVGPTVYTYGHRPFGWVTGRVRLLLFPEYAFSDWRGVFRDIADPLAVGVEIPGPETDLLAAAAKEHGVYIAAQAIELHPSFPGHYFNAVFIVDPRGEVIYKRHKLRHLLFALYTSPHDVLEKYLEVFGRGKTAGETIFPVVRTEIGNLGMMVAHEIATPEVARQLTANGAEAVLFPTNAPPSIWDTMAISRAAENLVYMAVANAAPSTPLTVVSDAGFSYIIDYRGIVLKRSEGLIPTTIGAVIDIDAARKARGQAGLPLYSPDVFDYFRRPSIPPNLFLEKRLSRAELEALWAKLLAEDRSAPLPPQPGGRRAGR